MEYGIFFIVLGLLFGINRLFTVNTRKPCNEWGIIHKWVTKGEGENKYIVCETCKTLPSGLIEESDKNEDYNV